MRRYSTKDLMKKKIISPTALNALSKVKHNGELVIQMDNELHRDFRERRVYSFRTVMLVYIYENYFRPRRLDKDILWKLNKLSRNEITFMFLPLKEEKDYYFIIFHLKEGYRYAYGTLQSIIEAKERNNDSFFTTINLTKINHTLQRILDVQ